MAKKKASKFTISLQLGDKLFKGSGASCVEALASLEKPEKIMAKGVLTLSDGDMTKTMVFWPVRLKRLFYNKTFQEIQAKQLTSLLK